MTKWLQAILLMCSSKKGVSAHQLHRTLETTYKTAWFLAHRIREAMRSGELAPFGSDGGAVEVDETYIGVNPDAPRKEGKAFRSGVGASRLRAAIPNRRSCAGREGASNHLPGP